MTNWASYKRYTVSHGYVQYKIISDRNSTGAMKNNCYILMICYSLIQTEIVHMYLAYTAYYNVWLAKMYYSVQWQYFIMLVLSFTFHEQDQPVIWSKYNIYFYNSKKITVGHKCVQQFKCFWYKGFEFQGLYCQRIFSIF